MKFHRNLIFIDIETVAASASYADLSEKMQQLWDKKARQIKNDEALSPAELYAERAGIYAEFGKVVVISIGFLYIDEEENVNLRVKALYNHDEKALLEELNQTINAKLNEKQVVLCAHNGKEFDFPYLGRRMTVNRVPIPAYLQLSGKKPWEVPHIDTMEMWKFGDRKSFTSLELLTAILDIPSPKNDIDGSMVSHVYYQENDLERIAAYCNRDVEATAQVYLRLQGQQLIAPEHIHFVD